MRKNESIELHICYEEEDELETVATHTHKTKCCERISLRQQNFSFYVIFFSEDKNINSNKVSKPKEQIIEIYIVSIKTL